MADYEGIENVEEYIDLLPILCGYAFMKNKEMYIKWSQMSNQGFSKGE